MGTGAVASAIALGNSPTPSTAPHNAVGVAAKGRVASKDVSMGSRGVASRLI